MLETRLEDAVGTERDMTGELAGCLLNAFEAATPFETCFEVDAETEVASRRAFFDFFGAGEADPASTTSFRFFVPILGVLALVDGCGRAIISISLSERGGTPRG